MAHHSLAVRKEVSVEVAKIDNEDLGTMLWSMASIIRGDVAVATGNAPHGAGGIYIVEKSTEVSRALGGAREGLEALRLYADSVADFGKVPIEFSVEPPRNT